MQINIIPPNYMHFSEESQKTIDKNAELFIILTVSQYMTVSLVVEYKPEGDTRDRI